MLKHCKLCHLVSKANQKNLSTLLCETDVSISVMGEHQFYEGYAVVISKIHVREMHSMSQTVSNQLFNDVLNLGRAIDCAYKPLKINYASLGNIEEHLHWHIFPRYESDPNHKDNPWSNASEFGHHLTTPHHTEQVRLKLSPFLSPFLSP